MKTTNKRYLTAVLLLAVPFYFASCGEKHDHDHDHDHAAHEHGDHDHDHGEEHVHDEHVTAGPNGGHVVKSAAGFAFEIVVDKDRIAHISMLDAEGKVTAAGETAISGIAGERANPVKIGFAKGEGDKLVSDKALPAGAHVPMVLEIKTGPDAESVTERFELHLH